MAACWTSTTWPWTGQAPARCGGEIDGPERELRLCGKGWPAGEAEIHLSLRPTGNGGCEIVLREDAVAGPSKLIPKPLRVLVMKRRNAEATQRLAYLAEGSAR